MIVISFTYQPLKVNRYLTHYHNDYN